MTKKNPAAVALGRIGGARNTVAQNEARLANAQFGGRPRRVCNVCGEPVLGGHATRALDDTCGPHGWHWQTPSERRAAATKAALRQLAFTGEKPTTKKRRKT